MRVVYHQKAAEEYWKLSKDVRTKLNSIVCLLREERRLPKTRFKKISKTNLFEVRIKDVSGIYRAIGGFIKPDFAVVLIFQKKSQKLPRRIIDKAIRRFSQLT